MHKNQEMERSSLNVSLKTYNSSSIQETNSCVVGWVRITLEFQSAAWALEWDSQMKYLKVQKMDPVIQIYLYSHAPEFLSITQTAKLIKAAHVYRGWGRGCGYEYNERTKLFKPSNPQYQYLMLAQTQRKWVLYQPHMQMWPMKDSPGSGKKVRWIFLKVTLKLWIYWVNYSMWIVHAILIVICEKNEFNYFATIYVLLF